MGIILGALAGAADNVNDYLDKSIAQDQKLQQINVQSNVDLMRQEALEQFKTQLANQERQEHASQINSAAAPILEQGVVDQATAARANNFDGTVPATMNGDTYESHGLQGDMGAMYREVSQWPDTNPDKPKILAQLRQQLQQERAKVGTLTPQDLTPDEQARFAPTAADRTAARIEAASNLGFIEPKDQLTAASRVEMNQLRMDLNEKLTNARIGALRDNAILNNRTREDIAELRWNQQHTMTPEMEQTAQGIATGRLPPITGYGLRSPGANLIMARVMELNPDYNGNDYGAAGKAEKDFSTGKQGNSVRSFNVAISHLSTLSDLSDALSNGDMRVVNNLGNEIAYQTGKPAPTNFEAAKRIVGDEIVKAVTGAGGALGDREEAARTLSAANSPAQLHGVISTYLDLMRGQLDGLRLQYQSTTGKNDFDERFLSDSARAALGRGTGSRPGGAGAQGPSVGSVVRGYRFNGGNPADPKSWSPAQ